MRWRERPDEAYTKYVKSQLFMAELTGLELLFEERSVVISLKGTYSIKKRKIISPNGVRECYKIQIKNFYSEAPYLAISESKDITQVYPVVQTKGILFKASKKILIDRKKDRIIFSIDSAGKLILLASS